MRPAVFALHVSAPCHWIFVDPSNHRAEKLSGLNSKRHSIILLNDLKT